MAVTYPVSPTSATLDNVLTVAVPRDFRDSGWVQGTAVVKDATVANKTFQAAEVQRIVRRFDLKTGVYKDASLAAATLATTDTIQVVGLSKGDIITGGLLKVLRVSSGGATATITVKLGSTAISAAIDTLALGNTAVATAVPIAVTANDTVDFLLTGTTTPVFDCQVELVLFVVPSSRA